MEDKSTRLNTDTVENLTQFLSAQLAEGGFQVVPRDQIRHRLLSEKKESYRSCYDQSCQIELGRELAAQKTLSTTILPIGDTCQVTAVLYDLKKATTEQAATASATCDENAMLKAVKEVAGKLCATLDKKKPAMSDKEKEEMQQFMAQLQPGTLVFRTSPEGAQIVVEDKPAGQSPLNKELQPGEYTLTASLEGYRPVAGVAMIKATQKTEISISLERIPPYISWGHAAFWSGIGMSLLGTASGIYAKSCADKYKEGEVDKYEESKTFAGLMYAFAGTGIALIGTGILLWVIESTYDEPSGLPQLSVGATPDGSAWTFGLAGRW
jgi:hypothetical protein